MVDDRTLDTIAVSTADSKEAILAANNSAAWTLDYEKWKDRLRYLVCLRKEGTKRRAFLVCKISDIRFRADPADSRPRYSIEFDEFSEVPADTGPVDGTRYPVSFGELGTKKFGFDPSKLNFRSAPAKTLDYSYLPRVEEARPEAGIGISEAKRRLAVGLGVREDQIDIVIRA